MQTLLFCLPSERTAYYTDNGDNFSLTENLDNIISGYSYIYLWLHYATSFFSESSQIYKIPWAQTYGK